MKKNKDMSIQRIINQREEQVPDRVRGVNHREAPLAGVPWILTRASLSLKLKVG